ncbi:hypothetical protein FOA52_011902 [Chlamydomonas sp. UWO 241]|nr:hypothetical protein FOA52_011902 [Chlamydomonas sp. UWO 241]
MDVLQGLLKEGTAQQRAGQHATAAALSHMEAERLIEGLQTMRVEDVGSPKWAAMQSAVRELNMQAHINAQTNSDEFVVELFVTLDKVQVLVHNLLVIEAWKELVLPHLKKALVDNIDPMRQYMLLYQECEAANLLECLLFHSHAVEAIPEEYLLELADWCHRRLSYLLSKEGAEFGDRQAERSAMEMNAQLAQTAMQEFEHQQGQLSFAVAVQSIAVTRYLTDAMPTAPMGLLGRLVSTNDTLMALLPLIERPPWVRRRKGKLERWETAGGMAWKAVDAADRLKIGQWELQLWLAINNLVVDPKARAKSSMDEWRKDRLLGLKRHLNELLFDQVPVLKDLQRVLDEIGLGAGVDKDQYKQAGLILEQLPDRLMASPVPPDGPPPVRAPDDNPASPMLVDDDVVPPPAEEPKKRNAFDLMKASNLKAASLQYIGMGHAELDDFGNDSFQQLKDHFWSGDGLPNSPFSARGESFMATLDTEFKHVKTVIKDRLALTPSATMLNLWRFIARSSDSLMVPNIILLMNVYYVMALHTAEVERGFSIHRILKNRLRSRLMILMVDSLLRIWHLAQSFTGPRESENNSLINEAAERLSGASLQSQGVNPPSLLKRLVEEVSCVQVSFLDRDLDEAAKLLEKEGLEDVDPAVAFDVEGNIVEEEDAASGDVPEIQDGLTKGRDWRLVALEQAKTHFNRSQVGVHDDIEALSKMLDMMVEMDGAGKVPKDGGGPGGGAGGGDSLPGTVRVETRRKVDTAKAASMSSSAAAHAEGGVWEPWSNYELRIDAAQPPDPVEVAGEGSKGGPAPVVHGLRYRLLAPEGGAENPLPSAGKLVFRTTLTPGKGATRVTIDHHRLLAEALIKLPDAPVRDAVSELPLIVWVTAGLLATDGVVLQLKLKRADKPVQRDVTTGYWNVYHPVGGALTVKRGLADELDKSGAQPAAAPASRITPLTSGAGQRRAGGGYGFEGGSGDGDYGGMQPKSWSPAVRAYGTDEASPANQSSAPAAAAAAPAGAPGGAGQAAAAAAGAGVPGVGGKAAAAPAGGLPGGEVAPVVIDEDDLNLPD